MEVANAPGPGVRRVVVTDVRPEERAELVALLRRLDARDVVVAGPDLRRRRRAGQRRSQSPRT